MSVAARTKGLVERSLVLGFVAVACLLAMCAAVAAWSGSVVISNADRLEHSYQVLQGLSLTQAELTEAESAARGYFSAADEPMALEFQAHRLGALSRFHSLAEISDGDKAHRRLLDTVRSALEVRMADLSDSISFRRSHGLAALLSRPHQDQRRLARLHLIGLLTGLQRSEERSISTGHLEASNSTRLATTSFWLTSLIGIAGVTGFFILVARLIRAQQILKAAEMTRAHELEHRVAERTAELTEAIADLEAFSYSVSHDLRTPLRAISGYAGMVQENLAESANLENRELLQRVRSNCSRMFGLMDALMSLAKLSRTDLTRAEIDISKLAAEVVTETLAEEPQRNIRVRIEPNMHAVGDTAMVRILLANLIGNSVKFTGKIERPTVEIGRLDSEEGGFFIRDNGAGFDQAFAGSIFKPFERLHRESEFKGTGIGLATCAKIVRRHGGRIWIESIKNSGTTVFFVLSKSVHETNGHEPTEPGASKPEPSSWVL